MESLVQYLHRKTGIIQEIIQSDNLKLAKAIYRLSLHYGISLKSFLMYSLYYEFQQKTIQHIFREDSYLSPLIIEYFSKNGGNFDWLVDQIKVWSIKHQAGKSTRKLKKVVNKSMSQIETTLGHIMSNELIHFCNLICQYANEQQEQAGKILICIFVYFRVMNPKFFIELQTEEQRHILAVTKILTKIASGQYQHPKLSNFIRKHSVRFHQIVAASIVNYRDCEYSAREILRPQKFLYWKNVLLQELDQYREQELEIRRLRPTQSCFEVRSKRTSYLLPEPPKKSELIRLQSVGKVSNSLECLIENARLRNSADFPTLSNDLQFFYIWTNDDLIRFLSSEDIDLQFFKDWQIKGETFLQFDAETLEMMSYPGNFEIVLKLVDDCQKIAISDPQKISSEKLTEWSEREIYLWLILSKLHHLIPIFIELEIDGTGLMSLDVNDLRDLEIYQPDDIQKILKLQQLHQ